MSERTIEIPELVKFVHRVLPFNILDIGCHDSAFYAKHLIKYGVYTGIDLLPIGDEVVYIDKFIQDDVCAHEFYSKYNLVTCVSVIEHVDKPLEILKAAIDLSDKAIYVSFPVGKGEGTGFKCITLENLIDFYGVLLDKFSFSTQYFYCETPNGVHQPWLEVTESKAVSVVYNEEIGVQCVGIFKGIVR